MHSKTLEVDLSAIELSNFCLEKVVLKLPPTVHSSGAMVIALHNEDLPSVTVVWPIERLIRPEFTPFYVGEALV